MKFMTLLPVFAGAVEGASEAVTTSNVLDSTIVTFIVDAVKQFLGIMTTPPLGVFLTIGILGSVVGLVATIVSLVKSH